MVAMTGVLGGYLWLYLVGRADARPWVAWGLVPAFAAGLVTTATSSNGALNAGIGLFPMLLVTPVLLVLASPVGTRMPDPRGVAPWVLALALAVIPAGMVWRDLTALYRDAPVSRLTATVASGPYRGIRTTPERAVFAVELEADLRAASRPGDRVLFFDDLPAGYLFTSMRPATNAVWLSRLDNRGANAGATLAYYERSGAPPTVVVRNLVDVTYAADHQMYRYVHSGAFAEVTRRPRYVMYRRTRP
jgi:hypothetical protein